MEVLYVILLSVGILMVGLIGLTLASSGQTVRELIDRFFMFFLAVPEMLRNGCAHVIGKTTAFIKRSAASVGLAGEHTIQRIIGSIVLTVATALGVMVSLLTLIITFMGVYGVSDNGFLESLPVSVEVLMAMELIAGVILFGMLLLDVVGVTHITKFFTADNLSRVRKYAFGTIFAAGLIVSIGLLGLGGVIRADALTSAPILSDSGDVSAVSDENRIGGEEGTVSIPESYQTSAKILMTGIPIVSAIAGAAGFCGVLPFLAMVIKFILFVPVVLGLGILWVIGYAGHVLVNLIYNFIYALANVFITLGETIKGWLSKKPARVGPPLPGGISGTQPTDKTVIASRLTDAPASAAQQPAEPVQPGSPMYDSGDKNWNPLA